MNAERREMGDTMRAESELDQLRDRLDEAWWNEAPLCTIQQIEREIESRKHEIKKTRKPTR